MIIAQLLHFIFCRLAEVEKRASEAGFTSLLSPEIGRTILWFLRRWVATYLSVQESYYSEMSMALVAAFGEETEGAAWTVSFIIDKGRDLTDFMLCGKICPRLWDGNILAKSFLNFFITSKGPSTRVRFCVRITIRFRARFAYKGFSIILRIPITTACQHISVKIV
jgi:hypothetical protein